MTNNLSSNVLLKRIEDSERKLLAIENLLNDPVERVKRDILLKKIYIFNFVKVHSNYYEKTLSERASLLHCDVPQLCKSILFENVAYSDDGSNDNSNSQYYLVVLQYHAKFDGELLRDIIHNLKKPENRLPKKRFRFQLAPEEMSNRLTGFYHNGVSPYGLLTDIPVVLCNECLNISPSYIYMGGGKVDVKLGVSVKDFIRSTNAIVGKVSIQRIKSDINDDDN